MDDLIQLYDKMVKCRKKQNIFVDEFECTKALVQEYVGEEHNKLLRLKAECSIHKVDNFSILDKIIPVITLMLSILGVIYSGGDTTRYIKVSLAYIIILLIVLAIERIFGTRTIRIKKWINYVEVVLNDMEK